ncbi:MAG TPA: hypothetical protein ENJ54_01005 [Chloroflexi bacterium]|nr:hypothetical protein [Chloroflexota bacterium]
MADDLRKEDKAAAALVLLALYGQPTYHAVHSIAVNLPLPQDAVLADFIKAVQGCTEFCLNESHYITEEAGSAYRYLQAQRPELLAALGVER